jgi:hypothetical protein
MALFVETKGGNRNIRTKISKAFATEDAEATEVSGPKNRR